MYIAGIYYEPPNSTYSKCEIPGIIINIPAHVMGRKYGPGRAGPI